MDLANFSKSLSQMVSHEVFRDCSNACFSDSGIADKDCVKNCSSKHAQFLSVFNTVTKAELPNLQSLSQ